MSEIWDLKQLPAELRNEIKEYVYGPKGLAEHKWKWGSVSLTMRCYDDFDPDEFIPTDVRVQELKDRAKVKKRYPTLWRQPGFITHEVYMRDVLERITPGPWLQIQQLARQLWVAIGPRIRVHEFPHQGPMPGYDRSGM